MWALTPPGRQFDHPLIRGHHRASRSERSRLYGENFNFTLTQLPKYIVDIDRRYRSDNIDLLHSSYGEKALGRRTPLVCDARQLRRCQPVRNQVLARSSSSLTIASARSSILMILARWNSTKILLT